MEIITMLHAILLCISLCIPATSLTSDNTPSCIQNLINSLCSCSHSQARYDPVPTKAQLYVQIATNEQKNNLTIPHEELPQATLVVPQTQIIHREPIQIYVNSENRRRPQNKDSNTYYMEKNFVFFR